MSTLVPDLGILSCKPTAHQIEEISLPLSMLTPQKNKTMSVKIQVSYLISERGCIIFAICKVLMRSRTQIQFSSESLRFLSDFKTLTQSPVQWDPNFKIYFFLIAGLLASSTAVNSMEGCSLLCQQ